MIRAALGALAGRLAARGGRIALLAGGVLVAYQILILVVLSLGLGGRPTYARVHPVWENARRIVAGTPSVRDVVTLLGREPIVEYGRLHPKFGAAVWSFELTWASLLFFLSFAVLLGVYLGLLGGRAGWGALGPLGGAGAVGLLGASVSSLTHCGLGSFGVVLSLVGISAATIRWFAQLEPWLIASGYALVLLAIAGRAVALVPRAPGALPAERALAH